MNRISLTLLATAATFALASTAHAADLLISQPSGPGFVDIGSSGAWDGAYAGVFGGYGWGTLGDDDNAFGLDDEQLGLSGWLIGATLGANFTVTDGVVAGVVGDLAWSGISGYDNGTDLGHDVNWTGSLRGRVGMDAGAFLPYLTAGLAIAGATAEIGPEESSQVHFGWTAGAGVEVAAMDNITVDLQYRYSDYGSATYDLGADTDLSLSAHTVTAGVNFKF